ncbi:hypothetical protein BDZ89DRAFT_1066081 [Hymenopellis radicata]|nr:hypothetical protein BDZ89DRAFT_1066081 [Hymenopellis radicata]
MLPASANSHLPVAQESVVPLTGPAYYEARRAHWLTPKQSPSDIDQPLLPEHIQSQQKRLENLLNDPDKARSDAGWREGIRSVWQGLSTGRRLIYRLPLSVVVKITLAAWIRDKTWPIGQVAPEPDDELPNK